MDGQHFDMKDFQAGVTAPPFHVWCRSTTVPYFNDEFTVGETRAARGEDGKTYQVPADMKYPDWKEHFVDKTKDPADWLKKATPEQVREAIKNAWGFETIQGDISIEKTCLTDMTKKPYIPPANPNYSKGKLYQNNCGNCSFTVEMRRRGFDVVAKATDGMYTSYWKGMFKNATSQTCKATRSASLITEFRETAKQFGDGARGGCFGIWKGRQWGHFWNWEVQGEEVFFIDGQVGTKVKLENYLNDVKPSSFIFERWDDQMPDNFIVNHCMNRSELK